MYKTITLPVVLYGCEIWSLTVKEKHILRVWTTELYRPPECHLQAGGNETPYRETNHAFRCFLQYFQANAGMVGYVLELRVCYHRLFPSPQKFYRRPPIQLYSMNCGQLIRFVQSVMPVKLELCETSGVV
jgi:hypothetical protein